MHRARLGLSFALVLGTGSVSGLLACDPADPQGSECTAFIDDEIADEWQVDFVNMRAEPVYIEADCRGQPFTLTDAQGQAVIFDGFGCECFCDDLMDPGVDNCFDCSSECLEFSWVQRIEPGATWSVALPGHVLVANPSPIPASCVDQEIEADQNCFSRDPAEPGTYTVRSVSASTLTCSSGECDCTDPELGNCRTSGSLGERVDVETTLEFPGTASIVFEP
jgi:hypothetical protein